MMKSERYEAGLEIRKAVVGTEYVERALSDADELAILEAEIASLSEAVSTYDVVAPDRATAARAGIEILTALR